MKQVTISQPPHEDTAGATAARARVSALATGANRVEPGVALKTTSAVSRLLHPGGAAHAFQLSCRPSHHCLACAGQQQGMHSVLPQWLQSKQKRLGFFLFFQTHCHHWTFEQPPLIHSQCVRLLSKKTHFAFQDSVSEQG